MPTVDARTLAPGTVIDCDVCVVGAGPAGIALALELRGSGLRTVILESGGLHPSRSAQALAGGRSVGRSYYHLRRTRIRAFGGTANHWMDRSLLRARPLEPLDFESRPEVDRTGWPFGREALDGAYRRAAEICRLPADEPADEPPALPLDDQLAVTADFQLGPIDNFPQRHADLATSPDVEVLLHATAVELLSEGSQVERVRVAVASGRELAVAPRVVVLAAGGIENPRLLLWSRDRHAAGLGNGHDLVGRFFMEHPHARAGVVRLRDGVAPGAVARYLERRHGGRGRAALLRPADRWLRERRMLASAWSLHLAPAAFATATGRVLVDLQEIAVHRKLFPGTLRRLAAVGRRPADLVAIARTLLGPRAESVRTFPVMAMSEQRPHRSSRVTLGRRRDRFGVPLPQLDWRLDELDVRSIAAGREAIRAALEGAGIGTLTDELSDVGAPHSIVGGFHHLGTTRMDASPRRGVVDRDQRVHGVANLFVTGGSVFPSGGYANPTLTVVALAVSLSETIRSELRAPLRGSGGTVGSS